MGDEVSSGFRMGMMMLILAEAVALSVNLFHVVYSVYNEYLDTVSVVLSDAGDASLAAMNQVKLVPATVAYKIVYQNLDRIASLRITWKDGSETADYKTLLKNAAAFVEVAISNMGNGVFAVVVSEVDC